MKKLGVHYAGSGLSLQGYARVRSTPIGYPADRAKIRKISFRVIDGF